MANIEFSNSKQVLKVEKTNAKTINAVDTKVEIQKTEWEFFKKISGFVTDFLNKQINIPSTAFTPNFCLPTKEIFGPILRGKSFIEELNKKINKLSNISNYNSSDEYKQKMIVRKTIEKKFKL